MKLKTENLVKESKQLLAYLVEEPLSAFEQAYILGRLDGTLEAFLLTGGD